MGLKLPEFDDRPTKENQTLKILGVFCTARKMLNPKIIKT